jgi:cytochrome oxidase Cu insertion factor (SCO1/SenC/PrrC family)
MGYPIMRPSFRILIAAVLALAAVGAFGAAWVSLIQVPAPRITTSGTAAIGGPFTLAATNGGNVTDQTYRGKWLLIFFGYTFCPDVCPTTLNSISVALEKLGADADKLQPLFVTVDPQRDTREVMTEYLKSFDPRIIGLTGPQDQVDRVVKEYRVYVAQQKSETEGDDNYLVSHSAYIYLMDPQGKFVNVIQGSEDGEQIAAWLRKQMARGTS